MSEDLLVGLMIGFGTGFILAVFLMEWAKIVSFIWSKIGNENENLKEYLARKIFGVDNRKT